MTAEQSAQYSEQGNSALSLYSKYVLPQTVFFMEEPERGLTLEEQLDLADHIKAMARGGEYQFVLTSVSPVFLGIKDALIYDFDEHPTLPRTWHESRLARAHVQFLEKLKEDHKYLKNK
jgi:predicted ATPase